MTVVEQVLQRLTSGAGRNSLKRMVGARRIERLTPTMST